MATVRDFVRKSSAEALGPAHPCNDPDLSPLEFLQAVYRDPLLPMSIRIDAARGLLPYTEPPPGPRPTNSVPRCKIVIGGLGACAAEPSPEQINSETHSFPLRRSNSHPAQSESPGPINTETTSYPLTLPDYSTPPTPAELQEIKAAINRLRPDLSHHSVPAPHKCGCGHWIVGPCPLGERCRDKSKLN